MSAKSLKTPMTWAKAIVETMEDQGVDVAPILEPLSLDKKTLSDRDSMIEQDVVSELWEAAVIATGNQNLGFVVGRKIHTVLNSVVAYSLMSCTNLKMSCERLLRYQDIVAEGLELEMRETDHEIHLVLDILPSNLPPSPQAIKSAVAGFLSFMRWITRSDLQPLSMYLKESRPDDMEPYSALVTCHISFNDKENRLCFAKQDLLTSLPTADENLSDLHEQYLQSYREKHLSLEFAEQVKAIIRDQLPSGEPSQSSTANQLNMSTSTLKRRLSEDGTSYNEILDRTRHELALKYLTQQSFSLTDITYLLGFSQSSAFARAFKRWEGVSPSGFLAKER